MSAVLGKAWRVQIRLEATKEELASRFVTSSTRRQRNQREGSAQWVVWYRLPAGVYGKDIPSLHLPVSLYFPDAVSPDL